VVDYDQARPAAHTVANSPPAGRRLSRRGEADPENPWVWSDFSSPRMFPLRYFT